ncbi:hypothetical protein GGI15_001763 [Coemansia interrupta]|uniref:Uncharacterized protein n=1 Tax=Coemansia interrupta TaxID=1126814 RepID=A0A9W8HP89_9FUNG|nr:hypothetical protein GGI15_001763 [Coemansia interrupta]
MAEWRRWVDYNKQDAAEEMECPVRVGCRGDTTAGDVVSLLVAALKLDSAEEELVAYGQSDCCTVLDREAYVAEYMADDGGYFFLR